MFAPAGTDPSIVTRLAAEVNKVQADPQMATLMKTMNFAPPPVTTPAQFSEIVDRDMKVWAKIASEAHISVEE